MSEWLAVIREVLLSGVITVTLSDFKRLINVFRTSENMTIYSVLDMTHNTDTYDFLRTRPFE